MTNAGRPAPAANRDRPTRSPLARRDAGRAPMPPAPGAFGFDAANERVTDTRGGGVSSGACRTSAGSRA